MAILVATQGFLVPAAASVAWEALYDLQNWRRWDRFIYQIELLESPKAGALGRIAFKPNANRILRFVEVEAGRRMCWEIESLIGTWVQQCGIIENAEGAIVTFECSYRGGCESFVRRFMRSQMAARLEDQGTRFATVCRDIVANHQIRQQISQELAAKAA